MIQKILTKYGMDSHYDRWLNPQQPRANETVELTADYVTSIERQNPAFRQRHVESQRPGELLCQDTFFVAHLKGVRSVYLDRILDTFSSYAFAFLHTSKRPEAAVVVLHTKGPGSILRGPLVPRGY